MGYSSKAEFIQALAEALTQGNPSQPGVVTQVTTVGGGTLTPTVNDSEVYQYINWADQNIDASLTSLYQVPLSRVNLGAYNLSADITAGDINVFIEDATRFTVGDEVLIRDPINAKQQLVTIQDISPDPFPFYVILVAPVTLSYSALTTKVERIRYPDPIPKISARLAAAYVYDKHFAAQVEGNESEYGKYLRRLAYQDINAILSGAIRLLVPDAGYYTGRRYYNHALDDALGTRAKPGDEWFKASQ